MTEDDCSILVEKDNDLADESPLPSRPGTAPDLTPSMRVTSVLLTFDAEQIFDVGNNRSVFVGPPEVAPLFGRHYLSQVERNLPHAW